MSKKLTGRIAAVTGGANGIGYATVKRFLQEDIDAVAIIDINFDKAKSAAEELDPSGKRAFAFSCNVADFKDTERCFGEIFAKLGRVDILVNSAGINRDKTLIKMSREEWKDVIGVDLTGIWNCCKQVCPGMKEREYGKIVNLSSISFKGGHGQTNYSAAKAGVLGLTRSLARELAKHNVTVNAVCPAGVDTDMLKSIKPEIYEKKKAAFPRKRWARPEELASVIYFLSNDDSSFVNGEKIVVTDSKAID